MSTQQADPPIELVRPTGPGRQNGRPSTSSSPRGTDRDPDPVTPGERAGRTEPAETLEKPDRTGKPVENTADRPAGYRDVFRVKEFRAVFAADLFSLIGDQIAAVAVAVLLYQDSGSPLLAAAGYATAYVPWLLGGPLLAAWAERFPGRSVMVACDLARAALIGLAALPGMPSTAVAALVFAAALLAPPFDSARSALLARILTGNRYPVGMSLRQAVHQIAQLCGFAIGGALVLALSAPGVLALDCLTFLASATLLRVGLAGRSRSSTENGPTVDALEDPVSRPTDADSQFPGGEPGSADRDQQPGQRAPGVPAQRRSHPTETEPPENRTRAAKSSRASSRTSIWRDMIAGMKVVGGDAQIWFPLALGIVGAAYAIVPEAIATAYAGELGHGSRAVGLIMAAAAAGSVLGGLAIGRFAAPRTASRLMYPLALVGTLPLVVVAFRPGLTISLALFVLCGLGQAFQVVANTEFASHVPADVRTRAFGIAIAGLYGGQSLAILLAGAAAQWLAPSTVIAGSGVLGALGVLLLPHLRPAVLHPRGRHAHR